jgi:hypothetical protein
MASIINSTTTAGVTVTGDNSGSLQLATNNGTTAVTIDTSQNVGIGTTSPSAKLNINGGGSTAKINTLDTFDGGASLSTWMKVGRRAGTGNNSYINTSHDGSDAVDALTFAFGTSGTGTERMRITSGGNLEFASGAGFLQLATNQTMRVPSTGGIGYVGNINSASVFQIAYNSTSAGVQLSSGATSWGTFSDSRLKNITGTYTNALNDIAQIQPVKFTWKSDEDSKPQVGVIAQSIQNVVPEAVDSTTIEMDGTEEYLTVRYTELIPLMIASIQELNAKVDAQAVRIAELEGAR